VLGYSGVQKPSKFLESAIQALRRERRNSETPPSLDGNDTHPHFVGLSAGDYFHDGTRALPAVTAWHKLLRSVARKSDMLSGRVLDLVNRKMLLGDVQERISARDLCTELGRILHESQQGDRSLVPKKDLADFFWRWTSCSTWATNDEGYAEAYYPLRVSSPLDEAATHTLRYHPLWPWLSEWPSNQICYYI
jgi:hypothetical protein